MSLSPGLVKTPLVDSQGLITNPWARFIEDLESGNTNEDGSATGLTAADLTRISAIESNIANILLRLKALELGVQM